MKFCTVAILTGALTALGNGAWAQHHDDGGMGSGGGHHGHCPDDATVQPLLTAGDFNGNGVVDPGDVRAIARANGGGNYEAIMDRNADGVLDGTDVDIVAAEKDAGATSTALDRELVSLYHATKRYKDKANAIADGYRPFTQELKGHGQHYARMPFLVTGVNDDGSPQLDPSYQNEVDEYIDITRPEGLNYDENGELVAVFYYHGINVKNWVFANETGNTAAIYAMVDQSMAMSTDPSLLPDAFASHEEMWHQHFGPCWVGLDYGAMSFYPEITPQFNQMMTWDECRDAGAAAGGVRTGWVPAFNMMHVWLYKLNRCGVFAGTHEHVSHMAPEEPYYEDRTFMEWFAAQFGG